MRRLFGSAVAACVSAATEKTSERGTSRTSTRGVFVSFCLTALTHGAALLAADQLQGRRRRLWGQAGASAVLRGNPGTGPRSRSRVPSVNIGDPRLFSCGPDRGEKSAGSPSHPRQYHISYARRAGRGPSPRLVGRRSPKSGSHTWLSAQIIVLSHIFSL